MAIIVLAEDSDMTRRALTLVLRRAGHEVHEAKHGCAALRVVQAVSPDLVVTDLLMPQMDGIELIRHIREEHPDLRVLAISAGGIYAGSIPATEAAAASGADRVMQKPVSRDALLFEVAELVGAAA